MKRLLSAMLLLIVVAAVVVVVMGILVKPEKAPEAIRKRAPRLGGNGRTPWSRAAGAAVSFPPGSIAPVPPEEEPSAVPAEDRAAGRPEAAIETGPDVRAPAPEQPAQAHPEATEAPRWDEYPAGAASMTPPGPVLEPGNELESDSGSGAAEPGEEQTGAGETAVLESEAVEPDEDVPLLESVEQALSDAPPAPVGGQRSAESYLDEGNVYFNVGQYRLAIERYTSAIALSDRLVAAFYNRANAHTRNGEYDEALADYNRALELEPNDADALNNRGMLHLYRSNYEAALDDFDAALKLDPHDTTVMVNRGLAYLHSGNAASALVDFQEAASLDSDDAAAHYGGAQAAAVLANRESAMRHLRRALELDAAYAREAAGDPYLELLQGSEDFLRLLRESGSRSSRSA